MLFNPQYIFVKHLVYVCIQDITLALLQGKKCLRNCTQFLFRIFFPRYFHFVLFNLFFFNFNYFSSGIWFSTYIFHIVIALYCPIYIRNRIIVCIFLVYCVAYYGETVFLWFAGNASGLYKISISSVYLFLFAYDDRWPMMLLHYFVDF